MKNISMFSIFFIIFFIATANTASAGDTYYSGYGVVSGTIKYDHRYSCSVEYPLHVEFDNKTVRTVNAIYFEIIATHPGRSTNLIDRFKGGGNWDRIIGRFEEAGACYMLPELSDKSAYPKDLVWEIKIKSVYWK